jgi:murein DD-endopeptidase MepM/ murein hydrolase activator NlpD
MRIEARSRRTAAALAVFLLLSIHVAPVSATRRGRSSHHRRPAGGPSSHAARAAIKAKLKAVQEKRQQQKVQLSGKQKDIHKAQVDLRLKKARVARLSDQVRELQVRVEEAGQRLKGAENRLAVADQQVQDATYRLQKAEQRLAAHHQRLSRRIARSYMAGTATFADVLLRASSLSDFLDRQYYVDRIFNSDVQFLTVLREEQRVVAEERAELERKRAERELAKQEMQLQLQAVEASREARRDLLHRVETQKNLKEEELEELEQDSRSIAALLRSDWRREQELWEELHQGDNVPMKKWSGNYLRPVKGFPISSGFGMRVHPLLGYARMHTGIDFAAPLGTPIRAAADGKVVWGTWRGGYGRCIILMHSGGVATLYGHCSEIFVHVGQEVGRGDPIGATGSTGLSTGPHLHFEIRVNGLPVNPLGH